ncbi:MAG: serine hydrolase [Lachnospiraceae bacterium]|jgi:D-alanyl-D-alanine carboxypeptidase (penicillin-binding protein 5/6)
MIKWKRIVCLGMAAAMMWSSTAFGSQIIDFKGPEGQNSGNYTSGSGGPAGGNGQITGPSNGSGVINGGSTGNTGSTPGVSVTKPTISSEGAVLLNASTGEVLFEKNGTSRFYPASITKLMTALLTVENCALNDTVTFSKSATTNLESGAVTLNLVEGDKLTVEQCLYALMLKSANEVANGLAEHISGSVSAFADKMNARAKELGCTDTHFVNPNGLNNEQHYTTPRDMALIARAAFQNPTVVKAASTLSYQIPATKKAAARTISMGHKMLYPNDSRYYQGVVAGKTGYTSKAGNTLATCAEKNGVRLIAVVMKGKQTHYTDTKALFDYGFALAQAGLTSGSSGSTTPGGSQSGSGSGNGIQSGWQKDGNGWRYVKQNGTNAANEWLTIDGKEYWFDSNQYMATGWRQFVGGIWYYFENDGSLAKNKWVQNSQKQWFYVGSNGEMLKNTTTPDGFYVNASGVWAQ